MAKKPTLKVLFRKGTVVHEFSQDESFEETIVTAFIPQVEANFGKIVSYEQVGQHSEASIEFYRNLEPATEEEYAPLLKELSVIYRGVEFVPKKRLLRSDLTWAK